MKKGWLIIIIIALIIILAVIIYFLFFAQRGYNFDFGLAPDFSTGAGVGDNIEQATDANAWKNAALNPFVNRT